MTGTAWPSIDLADGAVVADEEAAFGDVRPGGGGVKATAGFCRGGEAAAERGDARAGGGWRRGAARPGRRCRVDAVAGAVEPVLAAAGAQHHLGMVEEVAVDRDVGAFDGKRLRSPASPGRRGWPARRRHACAGTRCR